MQTIAVQPIPSQVVNVSLAGQDCRVAIYQLATGLYCDLYVGNSVVIAGVIGQNVNRVVRDQYLGFDGDLVFIDTQGDSDPIYTGLGSRFVLAYLTAEDIAVEEAI